MPDQLYYAVADETVGETHFPLQIPGGEDPYRTGRQYQPKGTGKVHSQGMCWVGGRRHRNPSNSTHVETMIPNGQGK